MAFRPLEAIKAHPAIAAVGVFILGVVLVFIFAGGKSAAAGPTVIAASNDSAVASNSALVQAQLAAGVANQQTAAQVSVNMADIAAKSKSDELAAANQSANIQASMQVAMSQINAQKDTQNLVSTLSAQVSQAQIAAQQASAMNANATNVQIAKIAADNQVTQAQFMRDVQQGAQATSIALAQTTAARDVTINAQQAAMMSGIYATQASRDVQIANTNSQTQLGLAQQAANIQAQTIAAAAHQQELQMGFQHALLYQQAVADERQKNFDNSLLFQQAESNLRSYYLAQQAIAKS